MNLRATAGFSSETWKRRFALECVVGPGEMPQPSNTNGLAQQTDPLAPSDIKGVFLAITNRASQAVER